jgi:streptomycin 6-kinase
LAAVWGEDIQRHATRHGRPEAALISEAIGQLGELVGSAPESIVLHQDLHAGNILESRTGDWLAIDPKPIVGDPAFDAASLLRDRREELWRDPAPIRRMRYRLDMLASILGLDRQRLRGWGILHALAWGLGDSGIDEKMVACARWLAAPTPETLP